ncbi:hypothetical protein ANN_20889 [Periplaneta americana]|uniref:Uncharacterized protein n=1 Tax=Periplaneta americana TaxID=6978 RepID=A0ABQ8SEQ3_PERAM|nr:hypothetical protein ANN_20889 [Periplaneta americana]
MLPRPTLHIKTIRNSAQLSSEICENENPKKCRKVEGIQTRVAAAKEVCDLIITQANTRFQFIDYLILSSLLYQEKFECYKGSFPENDLNDGSEVVVQLLVRVFGTSDDKPSVVFIRMFHQLKDELKDEQEAVETYTSLLLMKH